VGDEVADVPAAEALKKIVEDGYKRGLRYVGYTNNNFIGAAHQFASVWDNGANLVDQLQVEIKEVEPPNDSLGSNGFP
jgi:hypothetical protein